MDQYGDFDILPKELKFLIFRKLDSCSIGRLLQLNKAYSKIIDVLDIWKFNCLSQWELSAERAKSITQDLSNKINWKREYRILEEYSKRIFNNKLVIRPADSDLAKQIDEDPNSLHYHAFTDANMDAKAVAAQGKFKLYPLPLVNFCVAYYEVRVEGFGPDEPIIGIGLALDKYVQAMPGWGKDSYGLHSDDGCFFNQRPFGIQFCEPWHQGDTFGLGINYATKELFVTKNGVLLGTAGSRIRNLMHMYPTVGVKRVDNKCQVNFGQRPFEFDIVQYLQELDKEDKIKSKWPFKLYSQIIQEFETQLLDSDDPAEVEIELMTANNYYENTELVVKEVTEVDDDDCNRFLEWVYNKLEILQCETTKRDIEANRPEMKIMLKNLCTQINLDVDDNLPVPEVLRLVSDRLFFVLSSNYIEYLDSKNKLRKAENRKNPDLKKKRGILELDGFDKYNAVLALIDQEFPDSHPLIRGIMRQFIRNIPGFEIPHVITMEDRVNFALIFAYRLYASHRTTKAEKDVIQRRKMYQEQHKGNGSFDEIYGSSPFIELKDEVTQKIDEEHVQIQRPKPLVTYTEEDKIAAQRYAMSLMFAFPMNRGIDCNSQEAAPFLLWYYLALEEPYDPRTPLDDYRDSCMEMIQEEMDYWEGTEKRWESVLRGTYGTLFDHNDEPVVTTMVTAWEEFVEIFKQTPEMKDKDPVDIIMIGVSIVMSDISCAFEMIKKMREERERVKLEESPGKTKKNTKLDQKSRTSDFVTAATVIVSIGLIAGAVWFFQKKWRK